MNNEKNTKRITLDLPAEIHTALKIHAAKNGISIRRLLEDLIRTHLLDK